MKIAGIIAAVLFSSLVSAAQSAPAVSPKPQPAPPAVNPILGEIQRATQASNADLSRLQIEKWKTDGAQRQQMQQVAESLKRNITSAVPGLISDVQAAPGSASKAFKLYHNLNVVYEFLNSLAESAGAFGRKEEHDPLAADASALDNARQHLAAYIEQSTVALETQLSETSAALAHAPATAATSPKKINVEDGASARKTGKTTKKKPATPPATPGTPQ